MTVQETDTDNKLQQLDVDIQSADKLLQVAIKNKYQTVAKHQAEVDKLKDI